jgi:flagellar hook-associated protein 1
MADILSTAVSGLEAFQQALAVTGNNIANASTPGYTRQQINLSPSFAQNLGAGYVGSGVNVDGVSRILDQFANAQLQAANQSVSQQNAYVGVAKQVDSVLGNSSNGIASALTAFFNSVQTLSTNPSSATLRQSVLAQAQQLAQSITQAGASLASTRTSIAGQVTSTVNQINSLASNIAALNSQIAQTAGQGPNQAPNTLLDQRDQLVSQLSQLVGVRTNTEANGAVDIYVGSGQALVVGTQATALAAKPNTYDASQLDIYFGSGSAAQNITGQLSGGSLAGYLQAGTQVVTPALSGLGLIATAIATGVNSQQAQGLTVGNTVGGNIFSVPAPSVTAAASNSDAGTYGAITATVSSIGNLTPANYVLKYDGSSWTATDALSGAPVSVTFTAGVPATIKVPAGTNQELTLTLPSGTPAAGDTFLIRPTAAAATGFSVALTDPNGIAAAGLPVAAAATTNTGSGTIAVTPPAVGSAVATSATKITFTSATQYTITVGSGAPGAPQTYTAGSSITANGWTFAISGAPAAGDTFSIPAANGAGTDNRNALSLAGLQNQGLLAGGTTSVTTAYATLVGQIGTQTKNATTAQTALQAVATQASQRQQNISGVNLDEEGAKLIQWQQAYAAAGKVISVAASLFQTLIADINA